MLERRVRAGNPPQEYLAVDENGVDVVTGEFFFSLVEGSIGDEAGGVSLIRTLAGNAGFVDNWSGVLFETSEGIALEFGPISDVFTASGPGFVSRKGDGATLTFGGFPGIYTYKSADGTSIVYRGALDDGRPFAGQRCSSGGCYIPESVTRPDGMTFQLDWQYAAFFQNPTVWFRLESVSSTAGYGFTLSYASDNAGTTSAPPPAWFKRTKAEFSNAASPPSPIPTVTYAANGDVILPGERTWKFSGGNIRRPGSTSDNITIAYTNGVVSSVTKDGITTNYARSVSGDTVTMTVTDALSDQTVITSSLATKRPTSIKDELNQTTSYQFDANRRLTRVTYPEQNYVAYTYDARGNVTERRAVAKAATGLGDIVTSASFEATCADPATCNKPTSTTDARQNVAITPT